MFRVLLCWAVLTGASALTSAAAPLEYSIDCRLSPSAIEDHLDLHQADINAATSVVLSLTGDCGTRSGKLTITHPDITLRGTSTSRYTASLYSEIVNAGSTVTITDMRLAKVSSSGGGTFRLDRVVIVNSFDVCITAYDGARVFISNSKVRSGLIGVRAYRSAMVTVRDSVVTTNSGSGYFGSAAISVSERANVAVEGGRIANIHTYTYYPRVAIRAFQNGAVSVLGARVGGEIRVTEGSTAHLGGDMQGRIMVRSRSFATLVGGASYTGRIVSEEGSLVHVPAGLQAFNGTTACNSGGQVVQLPDQNLCP